MRIICTLMVVMQLFMSMATTVKTQPITVPAEVFEISGDEVTFILDDGSLWAAYADGCSIGENVDLVFVNGEIVDIL